MGVDMLSEFVDVGSWDVFEGANVAEEVVISTSSVIPRRSNIGLMT